MRTKIVLNVKTKTIICVHNMFCGYSELRIFMNNEQSVVILWVIWCKNESFLKDLPVIWTILLNFMLLVCHGWIWLCKGDLQCYDGQRKRISFVNYSWNCPLDAMHHHFIELQHNMGVCLVTQQVSKGQKISKAN